MAVKLISMTTAWLTTNEMRAWRNFIESVSTLTAALESDLAPFDLTMGDYEVLVRLSDAEDERLRMCDLAMALQLSPSGLTRRLDGLVSTGLVERRRQSVGSSSDVRGADAERSGQARAGRPRPCRQRAQPVLQGPRPRDQVRELGNIFETVRANLGTCPS